MENEPELIRDQMQETRTALTEKLDTLQQKVADTVDSITTPVAETVQTVKDAVADTVESVKESVSGTFESVKDTFNLAHQVERHPWPMMIGSIAAGFALGQLLPIPMRRTSSQEKSSDSGAASRNQSGTGFNGMHQTSGSHGEQSSKPGLFGGLGSAIQQELDKVKGLGVSVGVGLLRDLMTQSMQGEFGGRVREWMDDLTSKLGGQPFKESVVATESNEETSSQEEKQEARGKDSTKSSEGKVKAAHEANPRW